MRSDGDREKDRDLRRGFVQGEWLTRKDNSASGEYYGMPSAREREREAVLADWLGEERRAEVFASLRPKAHSMGSLVEAFLKSIPVESIELLERIRSDWPLIVGEDNAMQCSPVEIFGSRLAVEVSSPNWMYILKTQFGRLVDRKIADYTGGVVRQVVWRPARRSVR